MCLHTIVSTISPDAKISHGVGYKMFKNFYDSWQEDVEKRGIFLWLQGKNNQNLPIWRWLHEKDFRPRYAKDLIRDTYPLGFHLFTTEEEAEDYADIEDGEIVMPVLYRGGHTLGYQGFDKLWESIVATEIMLMKVL